MDYEKNQTLTVEITDMTSEGEGVGKKDGFPFFVKDTIIGDKAEIRVTRVKKSYAYGRLEKVLTPSPFRVEPKCTFHRQCGGCQIQSMSYEKQLEFKQAKVRNNLIRIGGFASEKIDKIMEPIVGMEEPFYYRNKAQYPVGTNREGEPITGFYAGRTHSIVANTQCYLGTNENKEILEIILAYMKENKVSAYDETTGKGLIRHVLIRKGFCSGEIMVCLVVNLKGKQRELPAQQKLLDRLLTIPNMTSVSLNINTERTNVILGQEIRLIWGKETIQDTIHVCDADNNFERTGRGITHAIYENGGSGQRLYLSQLPGRGPGGPARPGRPAVPPAFRRGGGRPHLHPPGPDGGLYHGDVQRRRLPGGHVRQRHPLRGQVRL